MSCPCRELNPVTVPTELSRLLGCFMFESSFWFGVEENRLYRKAVRIILWILRKITWWVRRAEREKAGENIDI
jgi:hypothetical protein